ncbi:hypothetical protein ACOSQ3_005071 [Xanthoceras sorbifolium]
MSFFDFIFACHHQLSSTEFGLLAVFLWQVWFRRMHDKVSMNGSEVSGSAVSFLKEFQTVSAGKLKSSLHSDGSYRPSGSAWKPPPLFSFKLNTDASFDFNNKVMGLGFVIRNSFGAVLATFSGKFQSGFSVDIGEAMAIFSGIQFAIGAGFYPLLVESDSKVVVDLLNERGEPRAEKGIIVHHIFYFFPSSFVSLISFVPRHSNAVAHALSRLALSLENMFIMLEEIPSSILSLLETDLLAAL